MTLSAADRLAILDVITRADEAASRRDADAYAALFTPDAVLDGAQAHTRRTVAPAAGSPDWAGWPRPCLSRPVGHSRLTLPPGRPAGRAKPADGLEVRSMEWLCRH